MNPTEAVGPVVVHSAGTIRYANEASCALLGVDSPTAVISTPLERFVSGPYREPLREQFETLDRGETPSLGLTLELECVDGSTRDAVAVSSLVEWDGATQIQTTFIDTSGSTGDDAASLRESAIQQSPVGVTIADASREDEPLVYVNDAFVELTGYPRHEAIGRNCRFLQGEATREEPVAEMRSAIEAERPVTVELRNYRKDGSMFWNRVTISPIEDESGDVTHFLGFQEDISAAKIYEREKALFQTHAEMSDQVMLITDTDGIIEYVNPAFERVTGYSAEDAIGKTPRILNSGKQDAAFYEEMWETITAGETWESELTNRTKTGELYRAYQKIVPIADDRGEITHFAAIEPDITDEQLTEQVLDVLNRILRHNVRTAVNVIDGYVDLLETDLDDSERRAAIRTIRDRTTALEEISEQTTTIRNLLQGPDSLSPLGLWELESAVERYRETYSGAVIDLTLDVSEDTAIRHGDVFRIAFEEVIENAIVHNDQETPHIDITVTQSAGADEATIEIADNGPGIPESEWEIIKTGYETPLEHTDSIGLWLVYWSVTALGGSVELSSNEPHGSVIQLEVPVMARSNPSAPAMDEQA